VPGADLFGVQARLGLDACLPELPVHSREAIEQELTTLDFLQIQIESTERRLESIMKVSVEADLLKTLPCVGKILSQSYASLVVAGLFFRLKTVRIFTDEGADLIGHTQELLPLLAIEGDWKTSHAIYRKAPFSLTLRYTCPRAGFFSASFSARRRSISDFSSSSDPMRSTDTTPLAVAGGIADHVQQVMNELQVKNQKAGSNELSSSGRPSILHN
jgi:hypothetical protein